MKSKRLSKEEYLQTLVGKMVDIKSTSEPVLDFWPYVKDLSDERIIEESIYENGVVDFVYRNEDNSYDHVLIRTSTKNKYLAIIIALKDRLIYGYYLLDLNEEYGLANNL